MRRRFPIDVVDGRVVVLIDGARALLDTAFRLSLGRRPLELLGHSHPLAETIGGLDLNRAAAAVGTDLDCVLGCDVLARHSVLVDRPSGFVMFSLVPLVLGEDSEPLDLSHGVPLVDIGVAGTEVRALLATGARLSYMDPALASDHAATSREAEAHPLLGACAADVRRFEVSLGEYGFEDAFGVLPDAARHHMPADVRWVLGAGALREGPLLLDLAGGRISFPED